MDLTSRSLGKSASSICSIKEVPLLSPVNYTHLLMAGWWYTYPSEKYEFVTWDIILFPLHGKIKNVPNHQPNGDYFHFYLHWFSISPFVQWWELSPVYPWLTAFLASAPELAKVWHVASSEPQDEQPISPERHPQAISWLKMLTSSSYRHRYHLLI